MFGYITPVLNELKVNDYNVFKSYYCGLCFSIKNKFGNIPRLGLNYDTTFFAVLLDALSTEDSNTLAKVCIKHPLEKREFISSNNAINYATDLNLSLIYYKLLDDVHDDNTIKSLTLSSFIKHYHKKLFYTNISTIIKSNLDNLHILEESKNINSLDEVSHPFANLIGEVLSECPFELNNDSDLLRNNLYSFGYSFGKWIYLMDALDDLKEDMVTNKFNPIEKVYNKNLLPYNELLDLIKDKIDFYLMLLATNCSDIISTLSLKKNTNIIENVINLGLMEKYMHICYKL